MSSNFLNSIGLGWMDIGYILLGIIVLVVILLIVIIVQIDIHSVTFKYFFLFKVIYKPAFVRLSTSLSKSSCTFA